MMISNLHKGNSLAVKLCYVLLSDRFVSFFQASSTFRSTPDQRKKTAGFRGQFPNLCKTNMLGMHLRNLLGMRIFLGGTCLPGWEMIGSPCQKWKMEVQAGKHELIGGPLLVTNGVVTLMNGLING